MPHGVTNGRHGTGLTSLTITWLRQSCDSKAFQEVEEHIGATRVQNMALREVLCRPRTGGAVTSHNLSLSHVLFSLFLALSLSRYVFSLSPSIAPSLLCCLLLDQHICGILENTVLKHNWQYCSTPAISTFCSAAFRSLSTECRNHCTVRRAGSSQLTNEGRRKQ